jgi:hypothetical protein
LEPHLYSAPHQHGGRRLYPCSASSWNYGLGWLGHLWQYAGPSFAGIPSEFYTSNVSGGFNNGGDGTFIQNRQTWQYTDFLSYVAASTPSQSAATSAKRLSTASKTTTPIPSSTSTDSTPVPVEMAAQYRRSADLLIGLPNYFNLQTEVAATCGTAAMDMYVQDNYKVNKASDHRCWFPLGAVPAPGGQPKRPDLLRPHFQDTVDFLSNSASGIHVPWASAVFEEPDGKGDAGCPRAMVPNRMKNVAPRLGFNIDPFGNGKTSIRAAYGIFWDQARLIAWNRYSTAQPFDENFELTGLASVPSTGSLDWIRRFHCQRKHRRHQPVPVRHSSHGRPNARVQPVVYGQRHYWPTSAEGTVLPPNFNEGYAGQWNLTPSTRSLRRTGS